MRETNKMKKKKTNFIKKIFMMKTKILLLSSNIPNKIHLFGLDKLRSVSINHSEKVSIQIMPECVA